MTRHVTAPSLGEFFRDKIREAVEHQKLQVSETTEFYLVNLLQDFMKSGDLLDEEPLALLYCRATQAQYNLKISLLRKLGDISLYTVGFFPESFSKQLVDSEYYIRMGETAYNNLSHLFSEKNILSLIFDDLSQHFPAYVDILAEVSEKSLSRKDSDLLRLYESWQTTGSSRSQKILAEKGILPLASLSRKLQ